MQHELCATTSHESVEANWQDERAAYFIFSRLSGIVGRRGSGNIVVNRCTKGWISKLRDDKYERLEKKEAVMPFGVLIHSLIYDA